MWYARVNSYDEVLADPQLTANQSIIELDDPTAGPIRLLAHPVRYDGKAPSVRRPPPSVGEHTAEVLLAVGYKAEELEGLRRLGAVGPDRARTGFDRKASAPASSYNRKVSPAEQ